MSFVFWKVVTALMFGFCTFMVGLAVTEVPAAMVVWLILMAQCATGLGKAEN